MSSSKPFEIPVYVIGAMDRAPAALREADRLVAVATSPARQLEVDLAEAIIELRERPIIGHDIVSSLAPKL